MFAAGRDSVLGKMVIWQLDLFVFRKLFDIESLGACVLGRRWRYLSGSSECLRTEEGDDEGSESDGRETRYPGTQWTNRYRGRYWRTESSRPNHTRLFVKAIRHSSQMLHVFSSKTSINTICWYPISLGSLLCRSLLFCGVKNRAVCFPFLLATTTEGTLGQVLWNSNSSTLT